MKILTKVKILSKKLKYFLPFLYLLTLLIGLSLFIIARLFPSFDLSPCLVLGGQKVCTLLGLYIATLVSLPGYILLGSLLSFFKLNLIVSVSYFLLLITNLCIYFIIGLFVQKLYNSKDDPERFIVNVVLTIFTLLLVVFLTLNLIS